MEKCFNPSPGCPQGLPTRPLSGSCLRTIGCDGVSRSRPRTAPRLIFRDFGGFFPAIDKLDLLDLRPRMRPAPARPRPILLIIVCPSQDRPSRCTTLLQTSTNRRQMPVESSNTSIIISKYYQYYILVRHSSGKQRELPASGRIREGFEPTLRMGMPVPDGSGSRSPFPGQSLRYVASSTAAAGGVLSPPPRPGLHLVRAGTVVIRKRSVLNGEARKVLLVPEVCPADRSPSHSGTARGCSTRSRNNDRVALILASALATMLVALRRWPSPWCQRKGPRIACEPAVRSSHCGIGHPRPPGVIWPYNGARGAGQGIPVLLYLFYGGRGCFRVPPGTATSPRDNPPGAGYREDVLQ